MNAPVQLPPLGSARVQELSSFRRRRDLTDRETQELEDLEFRLFLANEGRDKR